MTVISEAASGTEAIRKALELKPKESPNCSDDLRLRA
jgi:hypothetical protein